jgi:predicted MFS family arabinose efflux permease
MHAAEADRASRNAALTLTLALPADTVLYLLLPLHASTFGVTLPEAGILLAANRIVRIFGYRWVARFYATQGPRAACLWAVAGAVLSAFGYAVLAGLWPLLLARLLWGLAFAAMNIANQALPTAQLGAAARRMGRARAIVAVGPMLALFAAGILADLLGPRAVFYLLGSVALLAPLFAQQLPTTPERSRESRPPLSGPDRFSVWSFCMGFALDGLFVFGLALIAVAGLGRSGVIAASVAMALRYASEILLSHAGGALADRFGARQMLICLSLGAAAALGLISIPEPAIWVGVLGTVILRALLQPLPAPVIAQDFPGAARWRGGGAARGRLSVSGAPELGHLCRCRAALCRSKPGPAEGAPGAGKGKARCARRTRLTYRSCGSASRARCLRAGCVLLGRRRADARDHSIT